MARRIVRNPGIRQGFPCFEGTRIPYDVVLRLVDEKSVTADDLPNFFPALTRDDWVEAYRFNIEEATPRERRGLAERPRGRRTITQGNT